MELEPGVRGRFAFIEAMAQAAGLVRGGGTDVTLGLAAVDRAKIRRPVGPDETVVIDVTVTRTLGRLTLCEATASVRRSVTSTWRTRKIQWSGYWR